MKTKKSLVGVLIALALGSTTGLAVKTYRNAILFGTATASAPTDCAGQTCIWGKTDGLPYWHKTDNSNVAMGGPTQTIDTINSTAATHKAIYSAVADSGSAVGITFDNTTALTSGRFLAVFRNDGNDELTITHDGSILSDGAGSFGNDITARRHLSNGAAPACAQGTAAKGAGSCTATGTAEEFYVTFTSGSTANGAEAPYFTVTHATAFSTGSRMVCHAGGSDAGGAGTASSNTAALNTGRSTTCSGSACKLWSTAGSTGVVDSTAYSFVCQVRGN